MREKLIELLITLSDKDGCRIVGTSLAMKIADALIANGVTIPVRCKDCVNYCGFERCKNGICDVDSVSKRAVYQDDFCSYGERRTDGN